MKKILLFLTFLLLGGVAFADSAPDVLNPEAVTNYTDMSVFYLSQLFGTVGNVLTGSSSQMMGHLFYKLNWGIFLVSSIIILYSVLISTLKLASEGVAIAPGKSALFSLIKLAIGISLVIPSAGTGYCVMQDIVMQVVVKGVGLADSIWGAGLDYLHEGGSVWSYPGKSNPEGGYQDLLKGDNLTALLGKDKLAAQIFQNEVCMVGSRDPITIVGTPDKSNSIAADGFSRPYYDIQEKDDQMLFDFPGLTDDSLATGKSCGTISWNLKNSCTVDGKDASNSAKCAITRSAMSKLVYALLPAAKQYYCYMHGSQDSCVGFDTITDINDTLAPHLVNSLVEYYPPVRSYASILANETKKTQTNFVNDAKRDGWIMAGRYYWDVMRITRLDDQVNDLSSYTSPDKMVGPQNIGAVGNLKDIILKSKTDFNTTFQSKNFSDDLTALVTRDGWTPGQKGVIDRDLTPTQKAKNKVAEVMPKGLLISPTASAAIIGGSSVINFGVGATFATVIVGFDVIAKMFNDWSSYHYNPIEFLYKLGQACIKLTLAIWIVGAVGIAAGVAVMSICAASNPFAFASPALVEWVKPIFMMIATMLWMAGFFLSYYVPLYPFMVFLFASFGWFISVIEAMVAAPLVALGMTHPESHDFLGKSEQAIMLLLSVFIQPSLLVIGLMAGIILSYVSFEMLIYAFSAFIVDVMSGSGAAVGSTTDMLAAAQNSSLYDGTNILVAPLLLIMFCTITYTLLTQSFSLVYLLRDNVMKWIGVSNTGVPSVDQMLGDTKGAISTAGKSGGEAAGSGTATHGAAEKLGEGVKKKDDERKESGVQVPGSGSTPPPPPVV